MDNTEKNLMSMRYLNVIICCKYVNYTTFPFECVVDNNKRAQGSREDSETNCENEWIEKYRALKADKIEEEYSIEETL